MKISNKRECYWRTVLEDNDGGADDHKAILHAKRWHVKMNKKSALKGGYYVEVSGYEEKKVLWEVVYDNAVEEGKENDEIGLQGLILIFLTKTRMGWLEKDLVSIIIYYC